jgi:hypothetical protein
MPSSTSNKTNPLLYLISRYATLNEAIVFLRDCDIEDPYTHMELRGIFFPEKLADEERVALS